MYTLSDFYLLMLAKCWFLGAFSVVTQLELCIRKHSEMSSYLCRLPAEAMESLPTKMSLGDPGLALMLRVKRNCFYFRLQYHLFSSGCSYCLEDGAQLDEDGAQLDVAAVPKGTESLSILRPGQEHGLCFSTSRNQTDESKDCVLCCTGGIKAENLFLLECPLQLVWTDADWDEGSTRLQ